ncbi:unnamed protein product (macronuclear) [Paramecium tetraurelia]|uniref:H/ACA ribonucleoprotein complex subunit 2 n=3 Tax=Paramecium TaxID=5884 RepID=A0BCZ7_PARTE|nr:uncharacterized protein GSPATT00004508001 [Paramecium tetraurelia]CAD8131799.1 unnamed protein product [Paramecium octaurelia]CAD8150532.1 unnamed protein product [Paramecium pentaurelia]CAK56414.1 unnamed protein product [Paramecium tetraurelia]|eukprot:XP_001423812.1 hypothetical protein (macronuclear) [Paramecium tetraurelia strain d4-2]
MQKVEAPRIKPSPIADAKLQTKILDLLRQALNYKQLKKGANEVLKNLDKGICELVILAADCDPIEIVANIPIKCEEKNVSYCFVSTQASLGRACGISRPVVAASIVQSEGSQLKTQIIEMKDLIDQLFI